MNEALKTLAVTFKVSPQAAVKMLEKYLPSSSSYSVIAFEADKILAFIQCAQISVQRSPETIQSFYNDQPTGIHGMSEWKVNFVNSYAFFYDKLESLVGVDLDIIALNSNYCVKGKAYLQDFSSECIDSEFTYSGCLNGSGSLFKSSIASLMQYV